MKHQDSKSNDAIRALLHEYVHGRILEVRTPAEDFIDEYCRRNDIVMSSKEYQKLVECRRRNEIDRDGFLEKYSELFKVFEDEGRFEKESHLPDPSQ